MSINRIWAALALACVPFLLLPGCDGGGEPEVDGGPGVDATVPPAECPTGTTLCDDTCVDTDTNRASCGACGAACATGEACIDGVCDLVCPSTQTECDGACADTDTDRAHCGACGTACGAGEACVDGSCEIACPEGQVTCGAACADLDSDPSNCGACDAACDAGQVCSEGACVGECSADLTECSGACVDVDVDPMHCGACDAACPAEAGASGFCVAGSCEIACDATTADCNADLGDAGGDGCETQIATDPDNCSACGLECDLPNAVAGCASGACTIAMCEDGWGDCDGIVANGCETSVSYDSTNCGACGTVCTAPEYCVVGACEVVVGETCDSAIALTSGTNSVAWTASSLDYLRTSSDVSCSSTSPDGADIVLSYTATTGGMHTFGLTPPSSTRWHMVATRGTCGSGLEEGCDSQYGNPMSLSMFVSAGETVHLFVVDSTSGSNPLDNPLTVEVTEPDCTAPVAPVVTALAPANGTTTDTLQPTLRATFDSPVHSAAGTITITGDMGTSIAYDLSTFPSEVTFDADGLGMNITPDVTFPPFEEITISWAGLVGLDCATPVASPTWVVDFPCADLANDPANCGSCGNTCVAGEMCISGTCSTQGTGESCTSPWFLDPGPNTVTWTATTADYLTSTPSCVAVGSVEGPDLVLVYTATTTGTHSLVFDKPTSTRWVAIVSTSACGSLSPELACISDWSPATMSGSFSLTAGQTAYIYVRDTSSGTLPLDNPMSVTVTTP